MTKPVRPIPARKPALVACPAGCHRLRSWPHRGVRLSPMSRPESSRSFGRLALRASAAQKKECRDSSGYQAMSCLVDAKSDLPVLNRNPLDLIEAHLVAPAIVELRRARRGVVRHRGGPLPRGAVL